MGFIENMRNALANKLEGGYQPQHLSDFSDKQIQKWEDERIAAGRKAYEDDNPGFKIRDARADENNTRPNSRFRDYFWTDSYGDDGNYETRVYDVYYDRPKVDKDGRMWEKYPETRRGKVVLRVPKGTKSNISGTPLAGDFGGKLGLYEAVLDDGTVLAGDDFENFIYGNRYGKLEWGDYVTGDTDELVSGVDKYKDTSFDKSYGNEKVYWDKKSKDWKVR